MFRATVLRRYVDRTAVGKYVLVPSHPRRWSSAESRTSAPALDGPGGRSRERHRTRGDL